MLELKNISFEVKGGSRCKILDHLSLTIKKGQFVAITGPNGGGKSTLAKIIMGIQKPTNGQVLLAGEEITNLSITDRAKKGISYAFQQPILLKGITVYDLLSAASGELIDPEVAAKHLKKVGLDESYLRREVDSSLSGGELKRIELASVLVRQTKVIIFDEPEAGIDLWSFDNLIKVFAKLKSRDVTIIIISHQARILKLADEIIVLDDGKIKQKGTPAKLLPQLVRRESCN